jgi:hypothetical protein
MPVINKKRKRGQVTQGPPAKKFKNVIKAAQAAAKAVFNRNVESKRTVHTASDGLEIAHNNFITLDGNLLECTQGTADPMNNSSIASRIGDEISLKGISIKFMVEMNERYSDVTFRMFIVKKAKGDTCDRSTFFSGTSGNKMIDTINTERFTVIKSKTFKMTAPNNTFAYTSAGTSGTFSASATSDTVYSRPTKICKFYVPGDKIRKGGKIMYENGTSQPKFFDYVVLLFAYSNYATSQDIWNVARLNDYVRTIHYKDA